jgi:hypothetical protein
MAEIVYLLCGLTSCVCAALLLRQRRISNAPLLFWGAAAFSVMALANILLFIDLVIIPGTNLSLFRLVITLISVLLLLYGLIWETGTK